MMQAAQGDASKDTYVFVVRGDMPGLDAVTEIVNDAFPNAAIEVVETLTEGQAISAQRGVRRVEEFGEADSPVTVLAVDHGLMYSSADLQKLIQEDGVDVLVWGSKGFPPAIANPHMFGWIDATAGRVSRVSVKQPLGNPETDLVVVGAFTFRDAETFHACVDSMVARGSRVNGEFYLDECINDAISLGLECRVLEMDAYVSWGTPVELETYNYWQSAFHKWNGHDYQLDRDPIVPPLKREALDREFRAFSAARPG